MTIPGCIRGSRHVRNLGRHGHRTICQSGRHRRGQGLFYGNPKQLWIQIVSILATAIFTAIGTLIVVYVTKLLTGGLRVDAENEVEGLDNTLHGERAFEIQLVINNRKSSIIKRRTYYEKN